MSAASASTIPTRVTITQNYDATTQLVYDKNTNLVSIIGDVESDQPYPSVPLGRFLNMLDAGTSLKEIFGVKKFDFKLGGNGTADFLLKENVISGLDKIPTLKSMKESFKKPLE